MVGPQSPLTAVAATVPPMTDTTTDDLIRYEVSDGIARITIDAPDQGNSLTAHMRDSITEHMEWASADLGVRVVVLTGAGDRHFCTGANLGAAPEAHPAAPRGRSGPPGRRHGADDPAWVAAAHRLDPRFRQAGDRRHQRDGGRRWRPSRVGL